MMKATTYTPSLRRKLAAALNGLVTVPAKLAILAFPLILGTSCTADEPVTPATPTPGQQVTITASLGSNDAGSNDAADNSSKPGTRMAYTPDDAGTGLKTSWTVDDAFNIEPINNEGNSAGTAQTFTLTTGEGTAQGTFSGTAPAEGAQYIILHPASIKDFSEFYEFFYTNQEQTGNDNRSHLTKFHSIMKYVTDYKTIDFSTIDTDKRESQSSCMKFVLTPGAAIIPTKITLASADGKKCFYEKNTKMEMVVSSLSLNLNNSPPIAADGTITAYMMMSCMSVTLPDAGITVTVDATDGSSYTQTIVPAGKTLAGGKMHTITAKNMTKAEPNNVMKFTVKVDDTNGFNIPFPTNGITTPADITVDWGDGSEIVKIVQDTRLDGSTDNFNHPYGKAGTYTITITSSQTDATQQQIPEFNFYNRKDNNNGSKLISMDTPLLNTNEWSFASCFSGCTALTTIHAELFKNNPSADTFSSCFYNCTTLTTIPAGLFDNNAVATDFSGCFGGCTKLKLNAQIFSTAEKKDRFKDKVMNFSDCFCNVGYDLTEDKINTAPASVAPDLWNYTGGGSDTWTTDNCFEGGRFSNSNAIKAAGSWGEPAN